jgi:hypothetical protein
MADLNTLSGPGALHLINYCRKEIKGAPCNSDCPKYGQHMKIYGIYIPYILMIGFLFAQYETYQ